MEVMERIGEERALINAHSKKRKWTGHALEGDSLLRTGKQMMLYWTLAGVGLY